MVLYLFRELPESVDQDFRGAGQKNLGNLLDSSGHAGVPGLFDK